MKNKGYTLIEVIIVIGIMAVLSALAFVSLNIIHKAKYNSAADLLNNQMSTLWVQTKTISQAKEQTSFATSTSAKAMYPLCMQIQKESNGTYSLIMGYDKGAGFEAKADTTVEAERFSTKTLPKIIKLQYISDMPAKHNTTSLDSNNMVNTLLIEFNKADGSVKYGGGTYNIMYKDRIVVSIYLDSVTGKHYIK